MTFKKLAAGGVFTLALAVRSAEAVFHGTLVADAPWSLEVIAGNAQLQRTAVQVTFIGDASPAPGDLNALLLGLLSPQTQQQGTKILSIVTGTVPAPTEEMSGQLIVVDEAVIPSGTSRIIVEVDPPAGGSAFVKVTQGSTRFEEAVGCCIDRDARLVYDVAPAP